MTRPYFSRAYTLEQKAKKAKARANRKAQVNRPHKRIGRGDRVEVDHRHILKDADIWQEQISPDIMKTLIENRNEIISSRPKAVGTTLGRAGRRNCWNVAIEFADSRKVNAIFYETELSRIGNEPQKS